MLLRVTVIIGAVIAMLEDKASDNVVIKYIRSGYSKLRLT